MLHKTSSCKVNKNLRERTLKIFSSKKAKREKGDQDGRVGGHRIQLHPPTHQKYIIHVKQLSLKITGNWRKDTCTLKAVRKVHMELCRKVKEVIRSLGEDSEEKGDYMDGDSPGRVSGLSHILDAPALRSDIGKVSPLSWLEGLWD